MAISRFNLFRTRFFWSVPSAHRPAKPRTVSWRGGPNPCTPARPAPTASYWKFCGCQAASGTWTPVPSPIRHPHQRSAPLARRVPSPTDAAPGGSPDPRPGRPGREVGQENICTPPSMPEPRIPARVKGRAPPGPPRLTSIDFPFAPPRSLDPLGSPPLPGSRLPGAFRGLHPSNQPLDDRPQRAVPGSQFGLLVRLQQELMAGDRADLGVEGGETGRGKGLR